MLNCMRTLGDFERVKNEKINNEKFINSDVLEVIKAEYCTEENQGLFGVEFDKKIIETRFLIEVGGDVSLVNNTIAQLIANGTIFTLEDKNNNTDKNYLNLDDFESYYKKIGGNKALDNEKVNNEQVYSKGAKI